MAQFVKILDTDNHSRLINIDRIMHVREDSDHEAEIKLEDGSTIYTVAPYEQFENILRRKYAKI